MKPGIWYPLKRANDEESGYRWPEETRRMWREHMKGRMGVGIRRFFRKIRKDMPGYFPRPAFYIFFPADCEMSGHLVSIRHVWHNLPLIHYRCWKEDISCRTSGEYFATGGVLVWTKHVLRKLSEVSPLFAAIWEDLKDVSPDECGIHLAAAPDPGWLKSIRVDEHRRFAEFRENRRLHMIGLDQREPSKEQARLHMEAFFLQDEKRYPEAEAALKNILERWPTFWPAEMDLIQCALMQDNPRRAYELVRRAQKKYPESLVFDTPGADCCIQLKDWRRAEWHLKRLWGLNPWDPHLARRYAKLAFFRQDYALAARLYEECREHASLSPALQFNFAVALCKTRRHAESLALFKALEKKEPRNGTLLNNIGMLLAILGRSLEALDYCRRAVELEPRRESVWDSLGFTQLKIRKYPDAAKAFLKAVEINPAFPDAWRHLLHAYHKGGQTERLEGAKAYVRNTLPEQLLRFEREQGLELAE